MRALTLQQIQTLQAIAEAGSLVGAAADLNMTPAALTARLKGLESAVGLPLFDRTSAGLRLNTAGRVALEVGRAASSARCANSSRRCTRSRRARADGCRSAPSPPPNISRRA